MTDPAEEAAKRAYVVRRTRVRAEAVEDLKLARVAEAAAREALKPLRELHKPTGWGGECVTCFDSEGRGQNWPCDTARLIYPEDEL